jgi:hypothetical protein
MSVLRRIGDTPSSRSEEPEGRHVLQKRVGGDLDPIPDTPDPDTIGHPPANPVPLAIGPLLSPYPSPPRPAFNLHTALLPARGQCGQIRIIDT